MLVLLFSFLAWGDLPHVRGEIGEEGMIRFYRENWEFAQKFLKKADDRSSEEEDRAKKSSYDGREENTLEAEEEFRAYEARIRAFQEGDGEKYYDAVLKQTEKYLGGESGGIYHAGLRGGSFTRYTYEETAAVLKRAKEKKVRPMVHTWALPSEREVFLDPIYKRNSEERWIPKSHSAFFGLYRMIRIHRLDIIFLFVLSLIAFGGYALDKESGKQIELLYTEPIGRRKLHWTKIGVVVFLSAGLLATVYLFVFVLGRVTEGIGTWNFPIVYYTHGRFQLIDLLFRYYDKRIFCKPN